ncbi:MAG TPA: hypothetical protein VF339_16540 [Gammaproteobacteria bacterium]
MTGQDDKQVWEDYYARISARRAAEAEALWEKMSTSGVSEDTVLALDFVHFASSSDNARALARQLAESYSVEIVPADEEGYLLIKGTTRPEGVCLSKEQHAGWVEFMTEVAKSHACVFSGWTLEAPSLGKRFSSGSVETE